MPLVVLVSPNFFWNICLEHEFVFLLLLSLLWFIILSTPQGQRLQHACSLHPLICLFNVRLLVRAPGTLLPGKMQTCSALLQTQSIGGTYRMLQSPKQHILSFSYCISLVYLIAAENSPILIGDIASRRFHLTQEWTELC